MNRTRAELIVHGRVQGVFFRQSTVDMARSLTLTGWVKNCPDGTVAVVFEGESGAVKKALEWCHHGPPAARVRHVDVAWKEDRGEFDCFDTRY